ncbi:hypothetical protein GALMADRAFT_98884 [Galerina marginata CBS 339.88]|uniref:Heme haloperoxidase family profile domain-containing protein n=1 Tax=Galerina marginata (strain CBS 339.88) TaxID=685588 RepID=A0A067SWZ7_GALM3|nr:hypothetical protein GALMADRAFT_98884 [Galerina marginata CBS 339.88]
MFPSLKVSVVSLALYTLSVLGNPLHKRAVDFFNPLTGGGSLLDNAGSGGGEPLNVIISGLSSPGVLTDAGVLNFAKAIGFSTECLGIHIGDPQSANLGDGNGAVNQTASGSQSWSPGSSFIPMFSYQVELRQDFGDANLGTCLESAIGGNHFRQVIEYQLNHIRTFLFAPINILQNAAENHNIVPDGYDIGRNLLVSSAVGTTSFGGATYSTVARNISGLLPVGSAGVNHGIAIDGIVTLLTVTVH